MSRHPIVTGHPHWKAFDDEAAKIRRAEAKVRARLAEADAARRAHGARMAEYEAEQEAALLEDRDPDPGVAYPGEFVEPAPVLGRRQPVEVFLERRENVEQMRRAWASRKAPELVAALAARDGELAVELRAALDGMRAAVGEMDQVRDSLAWVAACGGRDVPRPTGLFEVRNLLVALADALVRVSSGAAAGPSLPLNLDNVDIA